MDEELARIVAVAAMRSSHELGDLIPILKEHCPADVYAELSRGIAASLAEIGAKVLTPVRRASAARAGVRSQRRALRTNVLGRPEVRAKR